MDGVLGLATVLAGAVLGALLLAPQAMATSPDTLTVRSSAYGPMLFDGRGRALYLFTRDRGPRSRCYGACARAWPPLMAGGAPGAAGRADAALVGTTARRGGGRQVTYAGHPLYRYVGDRRPGQVTCQDVLEFGGTWLVVAPGGDAIR